MSRNYFKLIPILVFISTPLAIRSNSSHNNPIIRYYSPKDPMMSEPALRPLFYSNPTSLDGQKHKDWALRSNINLGFVTIARALAIRCFCPPDIS